MIHRDKWMFFSDGKMTCCDSTVSFEYDASGRRIKKDDITYAYDGDRLYQEGNIRYLYSVDGIVGFVTPGYEYYYQKNIQGDIIAIIRNDRYEGSQLVASYVYDAFGNHKVFDKDGNEDFDTTSIGNRNPFRYRGYYYDVETGFYYLQSRYYDPEIGRFISPDNTKYLSPELLGGLNLYAYCLNNPLSIAIQTLSKKHSINRKRSNLVGSSKNAYKIGAATIGIIEQSISALKNTTSDVATMTHYTTSLIDNCIIGGVFGNISYTKTTELTSSKRISFYSNIGNDYSSIGISINPTNWLGFKGYISENIGAGFSVQTNPWITSGMEVSILEGISINAGVILGDTTHELSINVGWATVTVAIGLALFFSPMPGGRAVGGTLLLVGLGI